MAELVDALDSGSSRGNSVDVRVILAAMQNPASHAKIAIIANGVQDSLVIKKKIESYPFLIAVDGGLEYCKQLSLVPHVFLGDADSVSPETLQTYSRIPALLYQKDKDKPDLQLAVELANHPGIKEIALFCALGNRTDHSLVNIGLLALYPGLLHLETENERLFVVKETCHLICTPGNTLSLLPLNGPVEGVCTQGLKWELNQATLHKNYLSLSNICLSTACTISVSKGDLLVCYQK